MKFFLVTVFALSSCFMCGQAIDSVAVKQVDSLIQVSRTLTEQRDFDKALEVNTAAEKLALEKLGRESEAYGNCCFNLGRVNYNKRDYSAAEKWYLEAKATWEIAIGKENADYAKCLFELAGLNQIFGYYEKSEPLYIEALAIGERVFGRQHLEVAKYISGLANNYYYKDDYGSAEVLMLESKAIRENISGKDDISYAGSLFELGNLYASIGNYRRAENYHLEVKEFYERKFGKENTTYCSSIVNLANIYYSIGNLEKSELYFLEAKNIFEVKLKIRLNPFYINCIGNLGRLYNQVNKYSESEALLLEVKKIFEMELGNRIHPYYTTSLRVLADVYNNMGDFEKAESLYLEAKDIFEKTVGKEYSEYGQCIQNLSEFYEKLDRISMSEPLLAEVYNLEVERLSKAMSFLSEQELANYTNAFQSDGNNLSAYLLHRLSMDKQPGVLPALSYDYALFQKGFLLTAASRLNSLAIGSPEAEELNNNLKGYRRRLAAELTKPIVERMGVEELEEKANAIEKELARSVAGYAEAIRQVKWQEVQSALKKDEAAIEFIKFKLNFPKNTDSTMYAALLLKPGLTQPQFIPLFEEKALDSLMNSKAERKSDYVNAMYNLADRGASALEVNKRNLADLIFKPLEKELAGISTIYYSPSGLLHRINLDAIPVSETETLADRYKLVELNSTRQLVIPTVVKNTTNDAVLFGGIKFEIDTSLLYKEPILASRTESQLSFSQTDPQSRGGSWNYLPGTEREVNAVDKIMKLTGIKTTLKKAYDGTEEAFKNIGANNSPSPRILHIATHGYFFPDPKEKNSKSTFGNDEPVFKISDHPMLRSGLILAGGNNTWKGEKTLEGREDGVLTAYEISQMDLSNTELVVLSACETGLGDIDGSEGVYGLQRAFKIAGVKYIIMSLWQVPDKQTSLLMTTFYKKWLEDKMTIPDAFHAAQKELRDIGLDPYQWAGFVLVE